jgi:hypothetical protein
MVTAASRSDRGDGGNHNGLSTARAMGLAAAEPTQLELQRGNDRSAADLLTLASVNVPELNRPSAISNQLVWGRWAIRAEDTDKLSVPFALARLDRHVTVADQQTGLFRANQTVPGELFPASLAGTVEFRLSRASTTYETATQTELATVNAANLTVDFSRRTFATAMDLTAASGIKGELRVGGGIRTDGIFTVRDADQFVSGAISLDGKEAGYLFERKAGGGLFRGRTLWGQ